MGQLPTPEQLQLISNIAHWIEGGIVRAVAVIALAQALGYAKSNGAPYLWPGLMLLAGLFLPLFLLFRNGFDKVGSSWEFIISDPQQRQHLLLVFPLLAMGAVEMLLRAEILQGKFWEFVSPGALVMIGVVFLAHIQYGTPEAVAEAVTKHRYLGGLIILAGLVKAAEALWLQKFKWLAFPWVILLLMTAALLISYREPEGAFRLSCRCAGVSGFIL